ncbi:hypothetical protein M8C21_032666, partial [Ambrosia artemisiifolia]
MESEQLIRSGGSGSHYIQMQTEPSRLSSFSFHQNPPESTRIFDELPKATIVQVSRPDAGDISPMLLSYTIDFQYKQFKWQLVKKASHLFYLHFALKKRALIEEIHEKQEQVKEWLQNLGIGDQPAVVHDDDDDDEPDDTVMVSNNEGSVKN